MSSSIAHVIGAIPGEGVGQIIVPEAAYLLQQVCLGSGVGLKVKTCPESGNPGSERGLRGLYSFLAECVSAGMPVLTGPLTSGIVYKVRKKFDLFYKLIPIQSMFPCSRLGGRDSVDILLVRQNNSGLFFGEERVEKRKSSLTTVNYSFSYDEQNLIRLAEVAFKYAAQRQKKVALALKKDGFSALAKIWMRAFYSIGSRYPGVAVDCVNTDRLAGELISTPQVFDVIVAPNLEGDILSDMLAAYICGARNLGCSGNFNGNGFANYQTVHGAALDMADKRKANPLGQILSGAMLLEYSLSMGRESRGIKKAVVKALKSGYATVDMRTGGRQKLVDAKEMTRIVLDKYERAPR